MSILNFDALQEAMDKDAKDPDGILHTYIKEEKEKKQANKKFYKSDKFEEILKIIDDSEFDSFDSESISYRQDEFKSIFADINEFYLFCDSILQENKEKTISPDETMFPETLNYFRNKYAVRVIYGQGSIMFFEKLENPIEVFDKKVFGENEGEEYGVVFIKDKNESKVYSFGDREEIIKHMYGKLYG